MSRIILNGPCFQDDLVMYGVKILINIAASLRPPPLSLSLSLSLSNRPIITAPVDGRKTPTYLLTYYLSNTWLNKPNKRNFWILTQVDVNFCIHGFLGDQTFIIQSSFSGGEPLRSGRIRFYPPGLFDFISESQGQGQGLLAHK